MVAPLSGLMLTSDSGCASAGERHVVGLAGVLAS
jgi:hypothetical protein